MNDVYEPTDLQVLQSIYSDIHKDLYGFRPRGGSDEFWNNMDALRSEIDYLEKRLIVQMEEEKLQQQENIFAFEKFVTKTIQQGAGNRKTALRWIFGKNNASRVCYEYGLPYNYFYKKKGKNER